MLQSQLHLHCNNLIYIYLIRDLQTQIQMQFETEPQPLESNFNYEDKQGGVQHCETERRDSLAADNDTFGRDSLELAPFTQEKKRDGGNSNSSPHHFVTQLETAETYKHEARQDNGSSIIMQALEFPHVSNVYQYAQIQNAVAAGEFVEADFSQQQDQQFMQEPDPVDTSYSPSQPKKQSTKNFVGENCLKIKTIRDIQLQNSEKRKLRTSEVEKRNQMNPWGYKFFGITESSRNLASGCQVHRSHDWHKVHIMNQQVERNVKRYSDAKNKVTMGDTTQKEVTKVAVSAFSQNSKEAAYHRTNQSAINMLKSYKTFDIQEKGEESRLVPVAPGNVNLAMNLNRKSQLDQPSYGRAVDIPEEYLTFQPKADIIHNMANPQVMTGRARAFYQSSVVL